MNYQLTLLVKSDLDDKARDELLDSVKKSLGKMTKEDLWGLKEMSYPIKHQDKAFYAHFEFETEGANISSLDKSLKMNEDILRYLLLKVR